MFFNKLINFFDKSGVWPSPTPPPLNLHMILYYRQPLPCGYAAGYLNMDSG